MLTSLYTLLILSFHIKNFALYWDIGNWPKLYVVCIYVDMCIHMCLYKVHVYHIVYLFTDSAIEPVYHMI